MTGAKLAANFKINFMEQPKRNTPPSQERNLREGTGRYLDPENVSDPVSFNDDEAGRLTEDEDLDREERDQPRADEIDDIKDSRQA